MAHRLKVSLVMNQFLNTGYHRTVLDHACVEPLEQVLKLPRAKASQAATELLIRVGLKLHLQHKPDEMSGDQQQRVAIAQSLDLGPQVVLFDEITLPSIRNGAARSCMWCVTSPAPVGCRC